MRKAIDFLKEIKDKDNVIIVFHNDTDGAISTTLLMKLLRSVENEPDIIAQPMPVSDSLVQNIKTYMPNKIIFVDLAVDQKPEMIKELSTFCEILIIDHHVPYKNLNGKKVVHYNPVFDKEGIYQSASYLVYKLCNRVIDMSKWLWLAGIGLVGDYNLDDSQDLVKEIEGAYEGVQRTGIEESILANIDNMITATKATKRLSMEQIVHVLDEMTAPEDIKNVRNGDKIIESFRLIETETRTFLLDAEASQGSHAYIIYELKSKYNLRSPLSTALSKRYPSKFIAVYQRVGNKIKVSARRQKGKNIITILEAAGSGLSVIAGGHPAAAGATVSANVWDKFRENLIEALKK